MPTDVLPLIITTLGLESAARLWGVNRMLIEFMFLSCMGRIPGVPMLVTPDIVVSATTSGPPNAAAASGAESSISNVRGHPGRTPPGRGSAPRPHGGRPSASGEGAPGVTPIAHTVMAAASGHTPRSKIKQDQENTRIASAAAHAVAAATAPASAAPGGVSADPSSLPSGHGAGGASDASLAPRIFHGPGFMAAAGADGGGAGLGHTPLSPSHVASQQPRRTVGNQPATDAPSINNVFQGLGWHVRPGANNCGGSQCNSGREQPPASVKRHCSSGGGGSPHFPGSSGRAFGPTSSGGPGGSTGQHPLSTGEGAPRRVCDNAPFGQHPGGCIRSVASAGPPLCAGLAAAAASGPLMSTTSAPAGAVAAAVAAAAAAPPQSTVSLHSDAPSLEAIYDRAPAPSTMSDPYPTNTCPTAHTPSQPLATNLSSGARPKSDITDGLERRISISSSVARSPNHASMAHRPYLQGLDTLPSAGSVAASVGMSGAVSDAMAGQLAPAAPLTTTRRNKLPEYSAPKPLAAASSCTSGLAAVLAHTAVIGAPAQPSGTAQYAAAMAADGQQDRMHMDSVEGIAEHARAAVAAAAAAQPELQGQLAEQENSMEQSLRQLMEQPSLPRHNGPPPPLFTSSAPSVPSAPARSGGSNRTGHMQPSGTVSGAALESGRTAAPGGARASLRPFMESTRGAEGTAPDAVVGSLDNWDPLMAPLLRSTHEGSGEHPDPGIAPHMRLPPSQVPPQQVLRSAAVHTYDVGTGRMPCAKKPQPAESALSAEETRTAPSASGVGASSVCQDGGGDMFGRSFEVCAGAHVESVATGASPRLTPASIEG